MDEHSNAEDVDAEALAAIDGYISDEEEPEYDVECIRSKRKNPRTGVLEYLVKWVNYPESQNTWEPIDNLKCPDLIAKFNEQEGNKRKRISTDSQSKRPAKKTRNVATGAGAGGSGSSSSSSSTDSSNNNNGEPLLLEDEQDNNSNGTPSTCDKEALNDLIQPLHNKMKGFERGLPIERIVGSCLDPDSKLWFFIKWKDVNELDLVDADELEEKAPRDLCSWYRERLFYSINTSEDPLEGFSYENRNKSLKE